MRPIRRTAPALIAASVLVLAACGDDEGGSSGGGGGGGEAADYPTDDINLYVPYAAGGPTDLAARTIGSCLEEEFGQTVIVENREGASVALFDYPVLRRLVLGISGFSHSVCESLGRPDLLLIVIIVGRVGIRRRCVCMIRVFVAVQRF